MLMPSRNLMYSFDMAPHETMSRSSFDLSHNHKTSFNVGDVIPVFYSQVLPGDTWSIKTSMLVRLQTLLDPILDDLYLDSYYFYVPNRLCWNHWKEFMGENTSAPWTQTTVYTIPQLEAPSGGWNTGTLADYMGVPVGVDNISVDALPFRAIAMIMSEWFRNENTTYPVDYTLDDTTVTGVNTGDQVTDIVKGGLPFKAAKYKDYFTSCLPSPEKGQPVNLPLGSLAPVSFGTKNTFEYPFTNPAHLVSTTDGTDIYEKSLVTNNEGKGCVSSNIGTITGPNWIIDNMYADLSQATGSSVNQLRLAFQIQKMLELDARSGTRYIEKIKAHFGVISPDARQQRPEYLGGHRIPLSTIAVTQSSETDTTPLGHQAAYSVSVDSHGDFSKSFTEHGMLFGFVVVRYRHTYQQGLPRHFTRKTINEFYWPMLANIGELPVLRKELYCTGVEAADNQVFGYNEAWADYRHMPNRTSGEMRSQATLSLDSWHLGDDYASAPYLSSAWIQEDKTNVDRVLSVTSSVANQLFGDFHFDIKATRVMPTFSIPGLIDHH